MGPGQQIVGQLAAVHPKRLIAGIVNNAVFKVGNRLKIQAPAPNNTIFIEQLSFVTCYDVVLIINDRHPRFMPVCQKSPAMAICQCQPAVSEVMDRKRRTQIHVVWIEPFLDIFQLRSIQVQLAYPQVGRHNPLNAPKKSSHEWIMNM